MSLSPCVPPTPWVTETSARLPIQSEDSLLPHSQPDASTQAPQAYLAHPAPSQLLLFAKLRCGPSPQQSSLFPGGESKALLVSAPWPNPSLQAFPRFYFAVIEALLLKLFQNLPPGKTDPLWDHPSVAPRPQLLCWRLAFSPCLLLSPPPIPPATHSSHPQPGPPRDVVCSQGSACRPAGCTLSVDNPPGSPS